MFHSFYFGPLKNWMFLLALRYTTSDGAWRDSAARLTAALANIRTITNHFSPKVDKWATANSLSSLTEDQVCKIWLKFNLSVRLCYVVHLPGFGRCPKQLRLVDAQDSREPRSVRTLRRKTARVRLLLSASKSERIIIVCDTNACDGKFCSCRSVKSWVKWELPCRQSPRFHNKVYCRIFLQYLKIAVLLF